MPTLHHQALLELETRLTAIGGWGAGGVQRSATFAVERTQRPAARIVAGVVDFEHGKNLCEWPMTPTATVSITADTDTQLDSILLAFCAALEPAWTTPGLKRVLPTSLVYAQAEHDATAYQVQIRLKFQHGPVLAYALDQSK